MRLKSVPKKDAQGANMGIILTAKQFGMDNLGHKWESHATRHFSSTDTNLFHNASFPHHPHYLLYPNQKICEPFGHLLVPLKL